MKASAYIQYGPTHSIRSSSTSPCRAKSCPICDTASFASWTKGRVTLLGDAARPTTPNMGQGACMTMESAYVLARALCRLMAVISTVSSYITQVIWHINYDNTVLSFQLTPQQLRSVGVQSRAQHAG